MAGFLAIRLSFFAITRSPFHQDVLLPGGWTPWASRGRILFVAVRVRLVPAAAQHGLRRVLVQAAVRLRQEAEQETRTLGRNDLTQMGAAFAKALAHVQALVADGVVARQRLDAPCRSPCGSLTRVPGRQAGKSAEEQGRSRFASFAVSWQRASSILPATGLDRHGRTATASACTLARMTRPGRAEAGTACRLADRTAGR